MRKAIGLFVLPLCFALLAMPAAHARLEHNPPVVTFDSTPDQMLMAPPAGQDRITGTVTDDLAGVKKIIVTAVWHAQELQPGGVTITQQNRMSLTCDDAKLSCTWATTVPNFVPGYWTLSAEATDLATNVATTAGPRVLVIFPTTS